MKKVYLVIGVCIFIVILGIALIVGAFLFPVNPRQHVTSDIEHYGHYTGNVDNQYAKEYIEEIFPEKIEEYFTDITYSYRAQNYANYAFEAYLEFTIEDKNTYEDYTNAITDGLVGQPFRYDSSYMEYTLDDELTVYPNDKEACEIDCAWIRKVLCNPDEHRVIFVALAAWDAWEARTDFFCVYFNRFDIDPTEYTSKSKQSMQS